MTTKNRAGRVVRTAAAVATGLAALAGTATTASASTSSSVDLAAATSYGFECNSQSGWVHQNWPNISVRSADDQNVQVRALLYRWDGSHWQFVTSSATYVGVSNVGGRERLGYDAGGQPYYFALAGQPSTVPSNTGYSFEHLAPGLYGTAEEYTAMGRTWQASNRVAGTDLTGCQV
jgi:hypothetical protein